LRFNFLCRKGTLSHARVLSYPCLCILVSSFNPFHTNPSYITFPRRGRTEGESPHEGWVIMHDIIVKLL
jgi:hypothetical protein